MPTGMTVWSQHKKQWCVNLTLEPDEAEAIASALGDHDTGAQELLAAATEARELEELDKE